MLLSFFFSYFLVNMLVCFYNCFVSLYAYVDTSIYNINASQIQQCYLGLFLVKQKFALNFGNILEVLGYLSKLVLDPKAWRIYKKLKYLFSMKHYESITHACSFVVMSIHICPISVEALIIKIKIYTYYGQLRALSDTYNGFLNYFILIVVIKILIIKQQWIL